MKLADTRSLNGNRLRFVLSTGRTGTTQFREFLKKTRKELAIRFEPPPSRLCYLLWNAERAGFMSRDTALKMILKSKYRMLDRVDDNATVVEFDSYLSPLICEMLDFCESPRVVHMVRHPYTWIQSMGNFKAASWRKYVVDYTPFTDIIHPEISGQWRHLDRYEKLAWSWRYVNEQILLKKDAWTEYRLTRFEDFVSENTGLRIKSISEMLEILDPAYHGEKLDIDVDDKLNKSDRGAIPAWKHWPQGILNSVNRICEDLMGRFGYEMHHP